MLYSSTRNPDLRVTPEQALQAGLAPDGGLFVPNRLPAFDFRAISPEVSLPECASQVLAPFFAGSSLAEHLEAICRRALDLPLPITAMPEHGAAFMLELFHGPTAAFKDFAARFLAACLAALQGRERRPQTVLVATSGDTGAAVAAAFHDLPGFRVVILYPDGRVSARQAHQLGAFGGNVEALRVQGSFDDCQRLAKLALNDPGLVERHGLTTANSISIGRLLPQISYYALASTRLADRADTDAALLDVIVPTGNLGNALACILAREMGFPIGQVHLATNANRTLHDYFAGARYQGRDGLRTLANAMDVGDPSNFERLAWLYRDQDPRDAGIHAESVDDETIRARIRKEFDQSRRMICPHTACAMEVLDGLRKNGHDGPLLVAATAHPAKFEGVIEPILGQPVPLPPGLEELLARPATATPLAVDFEALRQAL
ncbi:MAG: threonine synthase [Xanthomonadaceae bacterium]|nr:threonine synthase [Xanthomonadaceae bacterium]